MPYNACGQIYKGVKAMKNRGVNKVKTPSFKNYSVKYTLKRRLKATSKLFRTHIYMSAVYFTPYFDSIKRLPH